MNSDTPLQGKTIVLGVTGGIAAYKAAEVASRLTRHGAVVVTVMTAHATRFVAPLTFQSLTGQPVHTDLFAAEADWRIDHVSLGDRADVLLIAPATANILGKLAAGIADDLLTTTVCAAAAPVLLAPAMNLRMWKNPITQRNVDTLRALGYHFVGPGRGRLACGDTGWGRLAEPEAIVEAVCGLLSRECDYTGVRVLITAGPTREPLDPVRFLSNRSSGKMGCALAAAAAARGAAVTLVAGPLSTPPPAGVRVIQVVTAQDMWTAVEAEAARHRLLICAAAVADFRPERVSPEKIKKEAGGADTIRLVPTVDILQELGRRKRNQVLVGFAAETENLVENATKKLRAKNLDLIIANDVGRPGAGFEVDTNRVTLLWPDGRREVLPLQSKRLLADEILNRVRDLLPPSSPA